MSGAGSAGSADAAEARRRLGEALAALRRIIGSQRLDRIDKRLWSQEHPRPAAIRLIVNRAVLPDPPGA
jgi:hypothetical protein